MPDPLVCAIMLTRDRPVMAERAVRSFEAQTYQRKRLVILDTGTGTITRHRGHFQYSGLGGSSLSIGLLRNKANGMADEGAILVTWDDDDYSHPNRIAEQVALLQSSGAACVGYSQTLFWDTVTPPAGQAWVYSGAPIGASFAYWRKTWEAQPFENVSRGEDDRFWKALRVAGKHVATVSGFGLPFADPRKEDEPVREYPPPPRMIHHVHGGNTWTPDYAKAAAHGSNNWRRAPEWDDYCCERMAL